MNSKFQIKVKLIVLSVCNLFTINSFAQDYQSNVCTPKGTTVVAYITSENSDYWRNYYDTYYASAYPNAIQIETYNGFSSTRKFNCHGYAWHISEGGSDRWIGYGYPYDNDPEYTYWQDGSYVEVAQSVYPGKVNWSSGDHSAITTENPGALISKWNEYPLMKHAWDDSPYGTSNLKYYKLNFSISGPSVICSSGASFTINNLPPVDSIIWSGGPNLSISSGQNTANCTFAATGNGNSSVSVRLVTDCGDITLPQNTVWVGKPNFYISGDTELGTFSAGAAVMNFGLPSNAQVQGVSIYEWDYTGPITKFIERDELVTYLTGAQTGLGNIYGTATNACGSTERYLGYRVTGGFLMTLTPNPSTSETTVSIESSSEEQSFDEVPEWDLEVYDQGQQLKARKMKIGGKHTTLNTSGWKEGVYIVRANYNGEVLTEKLVVKEQ